MLTILQCHPGSCPWPPRGTLGHGPQGAPSFVGLSSHGFQDGLALPLAQKFLQDGMLPLLFSGGLAARSKEPGGKTKPSGTQLTFFPSL